MQKLMEKHRKAMATNGGFTLVELIVVIAIIAILAAVLVPNYIKYVEKSREGVDASTLAEVLHVASIEAASSEDIDGSVDITLSSGAITNVAPASGDASKSAVVNAAAAIKATVEGLELKSSDGKDITSLTIDLSTDTGAAWDSGSQTKIATLADGVKTSS